MRFSLFVHMERWDEQVSHRELFENLTELTKLAEATEAGMVGINRGLVSDPASPFGGLKQSGLGREGAREGLEEFTETQYFSLAWPA